MSVSRRQFELLRTIPAIQARTAQVIVAESGYRSWIFPRDPRFAERAGPILDLYQGRWEGQLLQAGDFVVCADEKPSIQARARKHPTLPAAPGDALKVEHEYERRGALCYLAAWNARRAKVFDRCAPKDASSRSTHWSSSS